MCKISNKLKLCTCSTPKEKLKHYWALHSYSKDKDEMTVGEPYFPDDFTLIDHKYNKEVLTRLLNLENPFDRPIIPKAKDRLEFFFTCNEFGTEEYITYGFEFKKDRWNNIEFDYFDYCNHYDQVRYGKIVSALESGDKKWGREDHG